jgi:hypothetical protein
MGNALFILGVKIEIDKFLNQKIKPCFLTDKRRSYVRR